MNSHPLISVIILTYKNYKYLYEAIDSVFQQDYENIELIISNDCSDDFDKGKVREYLALNKTENIKHVIVNKNEANLGTVKHANMAIAMAQGKYIKLLAADDVLFNGNVLTSFVKFMEEGNMDVATTKCAAYDETLTNVKYYRPNSKQVELIKNLPPEKLFQHLTLENFIGGVGLCLKKDFFTTYGGFDERYFLTEDWPTWLRMLRSGVRIHYLDIISAKYRLGGISTCAEAKGKRIKQYLWDDLRLMYELEVIPYLDAFPVYYRRRIEFTYNRITRWTSISFIDRMLFIIKYLDIVIDRLLGKIVSHMRGVYQCKISRYSAWL